MKEKPSVKPPNTERDRRAMAEESVRNFLEAAEENPDRLPALVRVAEGERRRARR